MTDLSSHAVARSADIVIDGSIELTVVVPAFNEAARLPLLLRDLRKHVLTDRTEVIVVDDGSTDDTSSVARAEGAWSPHLRIIRHAANQGKGAAVRSGVQAARGRLVAFLDADNATDLDALRPMCSRVAGPVGAVFGSRHAPGARVTGSPPIRGVMGRVFNHVVRFAAGTTISDTQCGAKVFWTPAARAVFSASEIDGFAFDVEVVHRLQALHVEAVEHPVSWTYRSGTKIRPWTPLRMLFDIARLRTRPEPFELPGISASWRPELDSIIDPLVPGGEFQVRDPVRVLLPEDSPDRSVVWAQLDDAGAEPW